MDLIVPNWHPILVHFTIALLAVAAVLFIVAAFVRDADMRRRFALVAEWNFWIGAVITVLTLLAGWRAFNTVAHDGPAHRMMLDHRNWALVTAGWVLLIGIGLLFYRRFIDGPFNALSALAALVLLGLLATTAWHGGELVYRHGLGVMSLPATGAHGHGDGHAEHEHGGAHESSSEDHERHRSTGAGSGGHTAHPHGGTDTDQNHHDHAH